ncbi:MAG: LLM class flavin-dependent oxidoreductase [Dehalococcoidia bacterium]|jgi:alkanesulfonate monooxygenase SsuD/methylene tetrahydromethanopterin reductase-like flavin-dependent oxidoreductase (luciferase family)|nr:LLM class flavin-dependent oxidoreductase [Dehalococcoidia bacterium]
MKFSNFLFPESKTPDGDFDVIEESLREAELSEELGYDVIWLAEHHFDGGCAYVDPTTFAAAIAARTKNIKIGFAVAQMALHHPIRFAEQIALVDNISKGRMIVGVGRGTAYNFYEFRGFGIDPDEAHDMLLEVEDILVKAWTTENYKHDGKYWQVELPVLRPQVYQKPHPPMIRACSGLESTLEMAREGRPFMMNVQSDETTVERLQQYQSAMSKAGHSDETVTRSMADSWVWRNIFVADTDAEAEKVGIPYFKEMRAYLQTNRDKMNTTAELRAQATGAVGAARNSLEHGIIVGSPETVTERLQKVHESGVGGVIIHFRLGAMPYEANANSLKLFAEKVAPNFKGSVAV